MPQIFPSIIAVVTNVCTYQWGAMSGHTNQDVTAKFLLQVEESSEVFVDWLEYYYPLQK